MHAGAGISPIWIIIFYTLLYMFKCRMLQLGRIIAIFSIASTTRHHRSPVRCMQHLLTAFVATALLCQTSLNKCAAFILFSTLSSLCGHWLWLVLKKICDSFFAHSNWCTFVVLAIVAWADEPRHIFVLIAVLYSTVFKYIRRFMFHSFLVSSVRSVNIHWKSSDYQSSVKLS